MSAYRPWRQAAFGEPCHQWTFELSAWYEPLLMVSVVVDEEVLRGGVYGISGCVMQEGKLEEIEGGGGALIPEPNSCLVWRLI